MKIISSSNNCEYKHFESFPLEDYQGHTTEIEEGKGSRNFLILILVCSRTSESSGGSFLNSTSIALQEQPSCPWGCVLAAVFPTFQVLCTCCGNTSIFVIGKKSYTFKYTKKAPANCKNSNILKMSLGPTSGIWNFHDFFMFFKHLG